MHAAAVLQKCLSVVFDGMHAVRARTLIGAVQALLASRRLILMDLARAWPGAERVRAPLKRLDRLLSNRYIQAQREAFYQAMMRWLIRHPHPLLLIDWSDLHEDCRWQLLRAALPWRGRAVTVLEMVFPESMKGAPRAEKQFLRRLRTLLPPGVTPILVTDAGFRTPWFRTVTQFGWYHVGRLRGRTRLQIDGGEWLDNRALHESIGSTPRSVPNVCIVQNDPWRIDLVVYRKPARGRVQLNRHGARRRAHTSVKAEQRERDPWLLVVSPGLRHLPARQVVAIYASRMQIEQSFRDLKCERFGCAFRYSLTRKPSRIAVLLLIHALATFVAWLAALTLTAAAQIHYGGITSPRPRRHYSQLRIGWEALRRSDSACTARALWGAFKSPPPHWLLWPENAI